MSKRGNNKAKQRNSAIGRWIKRGLGLVFVGAMGVATVFALLPKPVPVDVAQVNVGPMQVTVDEDGRTRVIDRYLVSAPLAGTIARMELRPGAPVEEGTLIATIEAIAPPLLDARTRAEAEARLKAAEAGKRQAQAAVGRAKAAHDFAGSERDRIAQLVAKGSLAQRNLDVADLDSKTFLQEFESTRFGVRVAEYEVETARAAIHRIDVHQSKQGKTKKTPEAELELGPVVELRSPIAGTVLRVLHEQEGVVAPGAALIELADPGALEIVVDVLTPDAVHIHHGDEVHITQWGGIEPLAGRVRMVEPSAFTKISALGVEEQRVDVIIDLLAPPSEEFEIGDGYRVEVAIVVWSAEEVVKLPVSALFRVGDRWAVWVVEGGFATQRTIEVGRRQGLEVQILDGVAAGDTVIIHPSDAVVDGVEVEVHGK